MNESDDNELVAAAMAGGPAAFEPIVRKYQDAVFGVALARLGDFHDAQDVAQAVFVEAYQTLANLREPAKLGNWLRKMAIYRSLDHLRRQKAMRNIDDVPEPAQQEPRRDDLAEQVLDAVGRLRPAQREAVTLFYVNGYSMVDVARISGTSVTTVKSRLHEARGRLKEEMLHVVEDVLKSRAPDEDFAAKVYEAITGGLGWLERDEAVRRIGPRGFDGLLKAAASPNWRHRRNAFQMQDRLIGDDVERHVRLLTEGLRDPNKKVRRCSLEGLMNLPVPCERKREQFAPLLAAMLRDPSRRIRRMAAWLLLPYAECVPIGAAFQAYVAEPCESKRWPLKALMEKLAKLKT